MVNLESGTARSRAVACHLEKQHLWKETSFKDMEEGSKEILDRIKEYVKEIEPESEVILFGSRARNESREDSDWDILILVPGEVSLKEEQAFRHKLFELELLYGQAISTFVYSKTDWEKKHQVTPLYQNIKREGITI